MIEIHKFHKLKKEPRPDRYEDRRGGGRGGAGAGAGAGGSSVYREREQPVRDRSPERSSRTAAPLATAATRRRRLPAREVVDLTGDDEEN